jgi:hypothetical protein
MEWITDCVSLIKKLSLKITTGNISRTSFFKPHSDYKYRCYRNQINQRSPKYDMWTKQFTRQKGMKGRLTLGLSPRIKLFVLIRKDCQFALRRLR